MARFCDERLLIGTFTNEASVEEVGEDGKCESGDVKLARCFVRSSPFAPHVHNLHALLQSTWLSWPAGVIVKRQCTFGNRYRSRITVLL